MKQINKDFPTAFIIAAVLTIVIFWQFFLNGLHPIPGNYLLAWYQPWKTDYTKGQTITIQHKPVADDTFRYLYPLKQLGINMIKKGELPLWNPYNGAGMPLLATFQSGFFNPFNIFFFGVQPEIAWSLYIIAQVFLLSFFMYLYCRKIYKSGKSAAFATIIFSLSGFVTVRLIFGNLIYPIVTLPLILYLIEGYIEDQKSKKIYLLPLAITFMLLAGHPHTMMYVIIVSVFYFIYRIITTKQLTQKKTSNLLFLVTLFSIGIGIASIQLLPTIELLKNSNMSTTSSTFIFDRFLLPPSHLISIFIPNYFGNQATYNYWGSGDYIETVAATGTIPLFFAYLALFGKNSIRKVHKIFFLGMLVVSILMTLNWFLPRLLSIAPLPIISTSPPSRIFVLTTFSIAILAGYGFDRWIFYIKNTRRLLFQVMPFIMTICTMVIATYLLYKFGISCNNEFIKNCRLIAVRNTFLEVSVFIVAFGLFFIYIKINNQKIKQYIPYIVIISFFLLGIYNSYKFLPFSQKETILPIHPLLKNIQEYTDEKRIFGFGEASIKTNFATFFRFYDPNYYDPLHNRRYSELIEYANTGSLRGKLSRSDIEITSDLYIPKEKQIRRERLLSLLGVGYTIFKKSDVSPKEDARIIWQDENWYIQRNNNALPRAYLINRFETINQKEDILERLFATSFNPQATTIIEEAIKSSLDSDTTGKLEANHYGENIVKLHVQNEGTQLLVLSDNYYPGWKAFINGKETKIYRANYTFRAIVVPPGENFVSFEYKPFSLLLGTVISFIAIIVYIIMICMHKKFNTFF